MNEDIKKFYQAVSQDKALQEKLHTVSKIHEGKELTEEELTGIWERDVLPIAKEAGYVFTLANVKEYEESVKSAKGELSEDELENVVGGESQWNGCLCYVGGLGVTGPKFPAYCLIIGEIL